MTDRRPLFIVSLCLLLMLLVGFTSRLHIENAHRHDNTTDTGATSATPSTGPDWQTAIYHVTQIENHLFEKPDPTRVGTMMTSSCACYTDTENRLKYLQQADEHIEGDNIHIDSVTFDKQVDPNTVIAFVIVSDNNMPTVDAKGQVITPSPHVNRSGLIYTMSHGADGQWRIADRSPASQP